MTEELRERFYGFEGPEDLYIGLPTEDNPPLPEEPEEMVVDYGYNELAKTATRLMGSARFYELLQEISELHARKQADYGTDVDPFANVRGAEEWGIPPWVGAMIRATDKVRRLQKYARTGKLSNEGAKDSFQDLAVYALIALILWEEENAVQRPSES